MKNLEEQVELVKTALSIMKTFYGDSSSRAFRFESIRKIKQDQKYVIGISFVPEEYEDSILYNANEYRITKYLTLWCNGRFEKLSSEDYEEEA